MARQPSDPSQSTTRDPNGKRVGYSSSLHQGDHFRVLDDLVGMISGSFVMVGIFPPIIPWVANFTAYSH